MTRFSDRPTSDLVMIFLAGVAGSIMVITTVAVIVIAIWHPEVNDTRVIQRIGSLVTTIIGSLVGYMAGRATGNGNGKNGNGKQE